MKDKLACHTDLDGTKRWFLNGKAHRDNDLPAVEFTNGTKYWYLNNKPHRDDGKPAIEYGTGGKEWFVNGERHRINGPAIDYKDNAKFWYLNGKRIYCDSQEEFKKYLFHLTFK